jgi:hypothetical protein
MDTITTIGIIGSLIIGAAGFIFGVYQYVDKKRNQKIKLRVTFQFGALTGHQNELSEAMFILKAANVGDKTVTINTPNINVKHSDGGSLFTQFGAYQQFPYELKPGDSVVAWHEVKPIARSLKAHGLSGNVKLEGYFISQVGDEYKAKVYNLDVDDWGKN